MIMTFWRRLKASSERKLLKASPVKGLNTKLIFPTRNSDPMTT